MLAPPYRRPLWQGGLPDRRRARVAWRDSMSDGCTVVSDPLVVLHCCIAHDRLYYQAIGGAAGRAKADREFLQCMMATRFPRWRAYARYVGVRALGWLWWWS